MARKTIFELDLVQIAKWHRRCTALVVMSLLMWVTWILLAVNISPFPTVIGTVMLVLYFVMLVMSVFMVALLQASCGAGIFSIVLYCLLTIFFSFLVLLSSTSSAGTILRLAGANMGFLGVTKDEWDRLRVGHCRGCGYSREGIELLQECPECQRVPQVI